MVKILKTKNASILKGLIKEKKSHSLNHIDASELSLKLQVSFHIAGDLSKVDLHMLVHPLVCRHYVPFRTSFKMSKAI